MPTSKLTLVCTDNVFTTSKSNTNILSFKFVQRRVSSIRKCLMDARRNSNDAIGQVLWSAESLQEDVRHCVSQMHKEILTKESNTRLRSPGGFHSTTNNSILVCVRSASRYALSMKFWNRWCWLLQYKPHVSQSFSYVILLLAYPA